MPVSIKTGLLKYKNPVTGEFISLNQVGDDLYSIIAPKYEDVTFPVNRGTLCIYDGGLYRATVDIPTSEEWDDTHWASTSVDDEMSDYATRIIDDNSDGLNKTWSANKISSALEDINSFDVQIVQELPTENIKTHTIYFVPKTPDTHDIYDEYIYVNNSWEMIGSTEVDISSKADKTELHITPVFSPGSNLGEYVCNLTFQEVHDAATSGKCDGCIMSMQGVAMGLELVSAFPNGVSFGKTMAANGNTATATITYKQDGTVVSENVSIDIFRLFAKTYAFNTGLFPVKAGDYCINENKFYKANTDISAFEVFNSSKWDEVTVGSELKSIASNSNAMIAYIESDTTSDHDYAIGDIFVYNNKLYKATSAIAENNIIVPDQNCVETTISSALSDKEDKPFVVTFTLTYDGQANTFGVTSDKTLSEIGEAYNNGKQIKSYVVDNIVPKGIVTPINELTNSSILSIGGMTLVQFIGTIYAQATPTSAPMGVEIVGMGSLNDPDEWRVKIFDYLFSEYTSDYDAGGKKITDLGEPTAAVDATTKGYVDTALATKEDKPDLIATYTISGNDTATCDKTIEEIGQAYSNGKTIEAVIIADGIQLKTQPMILNPRPNMYVCFVGVTAYLEGVIYIVLSHSSGSETIPAMQFKPMLSANGVYTAQNMKITQLANPTDAKDAANKGYIDTALATKEDKPGLEVTFSVIASAQIVQPGEDPYTVTCDTTDSDIMNAYENGQKIRAIANIDGLNVELPLYMIETIPNVGSLMIFMGTSIDAHNPGSLCDVLIMKAPTIGVQDWNISFKGVSDVQINGTSIVSNGIANIPIASLDNLGVVKVATNDSTTTGIKKNSSGQILLVPAASANIKTPSSSDKRPIVPNTQHEAAFYGLAKAAGDATQSASSNAVGTYTDGAKSAIQSMLDVPSTEEASNVVIVSDTEPTEEENKLWINNDDVAEYSVPTVAEMNTALSGKVGDVQVNGSSIISNGVASFSFANGEGLGFNRSSGGVYISNASADLVKAGANAYKPIVPSNQHQSAFYGLAKASGDVTQASSSNPVGTYTDQAKASIRSMIGAENGDDLIKVQDAQPTESATKIWLPETAPSSVQVPTVAEMNTALSGKVDDVQVNGTSVVVNGVASIPIARHGYGNYGVCYVHQTYGMSASDGMIYPSKAQDNDVKAGTHQYRPIVPYNQHASTFYGLAKAAGDSTQSASSNAVGTYTPEAKSAIQSMLGVEPGVTFVETVDGATPSITGEPNVRYVCGTVTELSITPPSSGTIEVIFVSGTTPTVLTIPNTVKFPDWVDLSELETSTKYDIIITDGTMGAVMTWAE